METSVVEGTAVAAVADNGSGRELEKSKKIYKIEDVARELGISKTTVSRALSGKGRISKETTERVKSFIATHDYKPNVMARGLAQKKTYNIGLVLPVDFGESEISFFKECMTGICKVAGHYSYDIVISMVEGQIERLLENRKVDGIILSRAMADAAAQKVLKEQKIPFVLIGTTDEQGVVSVDNKNEEACEELTSILIMKGYKKIALIGGSSRYNVSKSRLRGFETAFKNLEGASESLIYMDADNYSAVSTAVEAALEEKADVIIGMDDNICGMIMSCLKLKNVSIPEDLRLASFYDSIQLERGVPPVTCLKFNTKELGAKACKMLLSMLGEQVEEEESGLGYQVVLRESTH
jgi:DNA-binding LacI/PurR family transcriptional regulator